MCEFRLQREKLSSRTTFMIREEPASRPPGSQIIVLHHIRPPPLKNTDANFIMLTEHFKKHISRVLWKLASWAPCHKQLMPMNGCDI